MQLRRLFVGLRRATRSPRLWPARGDEAKAFSTLGPSALDGVHSGRAGDAAAVGTNQVVFDDIELAARSLEREQLQQQHVTWEEVQSLKHLAEEAMQERKELRDLISAATAERAQLKVLIESLTSDVHSLVEKLRSEDVGLRPRLQREGAVGLGAKSRIAFRPDVDIAKGQPAHVSELGHESLAELSMLGNHVAQRERLLREIMCVNMCTWQEAHEHLAELDVEKERYYWIESAPYRTGITVAMLAAVSAVMLVFWRPAAHFYGTQIAKEELPEGVASVSDLTTNQVGTWTWSWMEPMIGTASFVLLCCQFTRAQAVRMNMKPYGDYMLQWRANRVADRHPQYDRSMVRAWAKHMPKVGLTMIPEFERTIGIKGPTSGL